MKHLTESILSKKTGMYNRGDGVEIDADGGFLNTLAKVKTRVGKRKSEYFSQYPYEGGWQSYSIKTIDLERLTSEIKRTNQLILIDEHGAFLVIDKNKKSGFYLGFFGKDGKLSQVIAVSQQFRNEYGIDYDYPGNPEEGIIEFNRWLDENYK